MNVDTTVLENYMCSAVWSPHLCAVKRGRWVLDMYSIVLVCNKWDEGGEGSVHNDVWQEISEKALVIHMQNR